MPPNMDGSIVFTRWHQCAPPSSLNPSKSTSQMASPSIQPFLQLMADSAYTLQWAVPFPPQNCPFTSASGPPSNTCFFGPTRVHNPNGITIGSAIFAWFTIVTDRLTDRPSYSLCNNRLHVHSPAMQPNDNNDKWNGQSTLT